VSKSTRWSRKRCVEVGVGVVSAAEWWEIMVSSGMCPEKLVARDGWTVHTQQRSRKTCEARTLITLARKINHRSWKINNLRRFLGEI